MRFIRTAVAAVALTAGLAVVSLPAHAAPTTEGRFSHGQAARW